MPECCEYNISLSSDGGWIGASIDVGEGVWA